MNDLSKVIAWSPCEDLISPHRKSNYALIVLNAPINFSFKPQFIVDLWNQASIRVTVDGGSQRWLQWLRANEATFQMSPCPELITGDMDSIPKDVLNYFQQCGSKIIVTPDQNETDFFKSLIELNNYCSTKNIQIDTVYVLADTSGRFDQIMANINVLFKSKKILGDIKLYQIASTSLTWLLSKGCHSISIPLNLRKNQEWCSLIPVGAPCVVSSTGLKWNLVNRKLEFGTVVSTSNTYDGSPLVTVQTDGAVIWSMSIDTLL